MPNITSIEVRLVGLLRLPVSFRSLGDEAFLYGARSNTYIFYSPIFIYDFYALKVRGEDALIHLGDVPPDATIFLCLTATADSAASNRFLSCDAANSRHKGSVKGREHNNSKVSGKSLIKLRLEHSFRNGPFKVLHRF